MKYRLVLVLLSTTITPALAQSGPSEAVQRQACMSDALRLCAAHISERAQIRECMVPHLDQVSSQCRAVFDASKQAQNRSCGEAVSSSRLRGGARHQQGDLC